MCGGRGVGRPLAASLVPHRGYSYFKMPHKLIELIPHCYKKRKVKSAYAEMEFLMDDADGRPLAAAQRAAASCLAGSCN